MKVAARFDVPDRREHRPGLHEVGEGHVGQLELADDADHVRVEPLFHQCAVRADAELAAEHHVERVGRGRARFVAELHAGEFLAAPGAFLEHRRGPRRDQRPEARFAVRHPAVLIPREVLQHVVGEEFHEALAAATSEHEVKQVQLHMELKKPKQDFDKVQKFTAEQRANKVQAGEAAETVAGTEST